jgi:hypothetical protein
MPLSDAKLAQLGRKYSRLTDEIKALEADKKEISQRVIRELERRGTKAVENDGIRVSIVQQSTTNYSLEAARDALPARVFKKVLKMSIDAGLLSQQVQAGVVTPEQVAEIATVTPKAPYIAVGSATE